VGHVAGVLGVVFSDGTYLNSYYVAALSPATAALCGIGAAACWRRRESPVARALLACALLACAGYGIFLLLGATAVPRWLIISALAVGLAGTVATLTSPRLRGEALAARPVAAAVFACALLLPTVASVEAVARNVGPFTALRAGLAVGSSPTRSSSAAEAGVIVHRVTTGAGRWGTTDSPTAVAVAPHMDERLTHGEREAWAAPPGACGQRAAHRGGG
jgi:hypothetical protein